MKSKTPPHQKLASKKLKNTAECAEGDRLNRADFAILDKNLAAQHTHESALMTEASLKQEWLNTGEDAAWAHLRLGK